mgnify:CR=1 FL=1
MFEEPATYFIFANDAEGESGAQGTAVGIKLNYFATNCHVIENDNKTGWFKRILMIHVDDDFSKVNNWNKMSHK